LITYRVGGKNNKRFQYLNDQGGLESNKIEDLKGKMFIRPIP